MFLVSSSLNPLEPCVKLRMKMYLEQRRQAMLDLDSYIWVINNCIAYYGATYIRGFEVLMTTVHYQLHHHPPITIHPSFIIIIIIHGYIRTWKYFPPFVRRIHRATSNTLQLRKLWYIKRRWYKLLKYFDMIFFVLSILHQTTWLL